MSTEQSWPVILPGKGPHDIEIRPSGVTIPAGNTIRLKTEGKYCDRDIVIDAIGELYMSEAEEYAGAYEVTPGLSETVLETSGLLATGNITIKPIPVSRVDNDAGGQTVTIG